MNGHRKGSKSREPELRVWTYDEVRRALPYITSVMRSLREHYLQEHAHRREARKLADLPGRPDRAALIAQQEAGREAQSAGERFRDALDELETLDIYCLDPVGGEAAIPFVHGKKLAWFMYDLHDADPVRWWRDNDDPLEARRPIAELVGKPRESASIAN